MPSTPTSQLERRVTTPPPLCVQRQGGRKDGIIVGGREGPGQGRINWSWRRSLATTISLNSRVPCMRRLVLVLPLLLLVAVSLSMVDDGGQRQGSGGRQQVSWWLWLWGGSGTEGTNGR